MAGSRPDGFDYSTPDPEEVRCMTCNPEGMNRTGLIIEASAGTSTTLWYGMPCPKHCEHGLTPQSAPEAGTSPGSVQ
jgi:hypothetical protein